MQSSWPRSARLGNRLDPHSTGEQRPRIWATSISTVDPQRLLTKQFEIKLFPELPAAVRTVWSPCLHPSIYWGIVQSPAAPRHCSTRLLPERSSLKGRLQTSWASQWEGKKNLLSLHCTLIVHYISSSKSRAITKTLSSESVLTVSWGSGDPPLWITSSRLSASLDQGVRSPLHWVSLSG